MGIKDLIKNKFKEWEKKDKDNSEYAKQLKDAEKKAFRETLLEEKVKTAKIKAKILARKDLDEFDKKIIPKKSIFDKNIEMDDVEEYVISGKKMEVKK